MHCGENDLEEDEEGDELCTDIFAFEEMQRYREKLQGDVQT